MDEFSDLCSLPEKHLLFALGIENKIERAGGQAFHRGVEVRMRLFGQKFGEDAKRMERVEGGKQRVPSRDKIEIVVCGDTCGLKLAQKLCVGIVRITKVRGGDTLIEDRCASEERELLFFDGIAWRGQDVSPSGKYGTGDAAIDRGEKSDAAFFEGDLNVAATQFNSACCGNCVDCRCVQPKIVEGTVELTG